MRWGSFSVYTTEALDLVPNGTERPAQGFQSRIDFFHLFADARSSRAAGMFDNAALANPRQLRERISGATGKSGVATRPPP